jgi:glycine cleavage system aminomethyltransferase T
VVPLPTQALTRRQLAAQDVSGLKKLHVVGPHATAVLDSLVTRDCSKILPGKSQYACMLNERGMFVEDIVLFRMGPNSWMVVHGGGAGHELLVSAAVGRNCALLFDDDLHDLSLQGPNAVEVLVKAGVAGIRDLAYFSHMPALLFGAPVMISRTGYTGERGYEIFVKASDAVAGAHAGPSSALCNAAQTGASTDASVFACSPTPPQSGTACWPPARTWAASPAASRPWTCSV